MVMTETVVPDSLYLFYQGWFLASLIVLAVVKFALRQPQTDAQSEKIEFTPAFKSFQTNFLLVYFFMMGADWLQGPYVFALYQHYGYDIQMIGILFIVGFGVSLVGGAFVGSAADRYGRKKVCIFFGIIYGLSCIVKHWKALHMLLIGRFLGGLATSILFSVFETWVF